MSAHAAATSSREMRDWYLRRTGKYDIAFVRIMNHNILHHQQPLQALQSMSPQRQLDVNTYSQPVQLVLCALFPTTAARLHPWLPAELASVVQWAAFPRPLRHLIGSGPCCENRHLNVSPPLWSHRAVWTFDLDEIIVEVYMKETQLVIACFERAKVQ
jgi:hypothetical protein